MERDRCIGCGTCLVLGPRGLFVLDAERKAVVTQPDQVWSPADGGVIRHCPTYAISARPASPPETTEGALEKGVQEVTGPIPSTPSD